MGWRCDTCDTYNEEPERKCYVCGQPRTAESIREGKIREREERAVRLGRSIYNTGYAFARITFILGVSVAVLVTVIALITRILSGSVGSIVTNFACIANHVYLRIANNNVANVVDLAEHFSRAPVQEIGMNIEAVLFKWNSVLIAMSVLIGNLVVIIKKQVEFCYDNRIIAISNIILAKFARLVETVEVFSIFLKTR